MGTYTQLVRDDESGTYTRETKHTPETFYLVEYSTIATYYKVDAPSFEEACDQIDDAQHEGITSIDRTDVFIDIASEDVYDMVKQKNSLIVKA
jgi:hypothetical protein